MSIAERLEQINGQINQAYEKRKQVKMMQVFLFIHKTNYYSNK